MTGVRRRAVLMAAVLPLMAQEGWPVRPLRPVAPFAPGDATDICARIVAKRLSEFIASVC